MTDPVSRNRVAAHSAAVRSWAFFVFLVLMLVYLLADALLPGRSSETTLGRGLETAALAALAVSAAAQGVLLVVAGRGNMQSRHALTKSVVGRWALAVFEICAVTMLVMLVLLFVVPIFTVDILGWVFVSCLLVSVPSAVVWLLAEAVSGFREPVES